MFYEKGQIVSMILIYTWAWVTNFCSFQWVAENFCWRVGGFTGWNLVRERHSSQIERSNDYFHRSFFSPSLYEIILIFWKTLTSLEITGQNYFLIKKIYERQSDVWLRSSEQLYEKNWPADLGCSCFCYWAVCNLVWRIK